jgi:hypothetical protein
MVERRDISSLINYLLWNSIRGVQIIMSQRGTNPNGQLFPIYTELQLYAMRIYKCAGM